MRKVDLRMKEELKYLTIKKLVDSKGNKKRASLKLNCSIRTINRLILKYKKEGKSAFIHGNRGRKPSKSFDLSLKEKIINLYISEFRDTNLQHFSEIVKRKFSISITRQTLNVWFKEIDILSPKATRKSKRLLRKKLQAKLKLQKSITELNLLQESIRVLDFNEIHPRRSQCKYFGEMVQMDASELKWNGEDIWHLHLAIDDSTKTVVGAYFDKQETLKGYYHVFYQILKNYGIPAKFLTDQRSVFVYKNKKMKKENLTQFAYACHQLGIDLQSTSDPQDKGRIERLNQTFQSRLPVELRMNNIKMLDEANEFLKSYIIEYNNQFALKINKSNSVFDEEIRNDKEKINLTLSVIEKRIIDKGNCIKYKNNYYFPIDSKGKKLYFRPKTEVLLIKTFNDKTFLSIKNNIYNMEMLPTHFEYSNEFDEIPVKEKNKNCNIPKINYFFKRKAYLDFVRNYKQS